MLTPYVTLAQFLLERARGRQALAEAEWIQTDGLGGFASGTARLTRTRRYHALLLVARKPPEQRFVLVNGIEAYVETPAGRFPISDQYYAPGVSHPGGARFIERFSFEPRPRWVFKLPDGTYVAQELRVARGAPSAQLNFRLLDAGRSARLFVRPLLSGRDYHALHHENPSFDFTPHRRNDQLIFRPYGDAVPEIAIRSNGEYRHDPIWFRNFLYTEERARGLDHLEDLASPGELSFDLQRPATITFGEEIIPVDSEETGLRRAALDYLVTRGSGKTIVAGYPWFTDWGRDTFISLRGLCIATGRLDDARDILLEWSKLVSNGMLPNRFPDQGAPEYNSADASLWFIIAAGALLEKSREKEILRAIEDILIGYTRGTRYGIRLDHDGLIAAGVPGVQLTWMDAKVGDWVVTPRIGKPVEIQALWINALRIAHRHTGRWKDLVARSTAAFHRRFPIPDRDALYDVVDADHTPFKNDASFRPNQLFALGGGVPHALITGAKARAIVDRVERELVTTLGLRTLSPSDAAYLGRYEGGVRERDGAYHQGTAWPWLLGPFVEAWVKVRGSTPEAKAAAKARFVDPLLEHLQVAGLGHVSEIADGDPPHEPRGCPFQAWSLAELIRLLEDVLAP